MSTRLLLATTNPAKLARLRLLLDDLPGVELVVPTQPVAVQESAGSLLGNAIDKARAWACATRLPAVATDGGLSVPALGRRWRPALTRRAAGESASPEQHAAHLLGLLEDIEGDGRRAYQSEAIALAAPDGELLGVWSARGPRRVVADRYQAEAAEPGFWLPGVLLPPADPHAADAHWLRLRAPLRRAVKRLVVDPVVPSASLVVPARDDTSD